MHSKLAGHLPLQSMIADVLNGAREKLAAAEEKKDEKKPPFFAKKDEKKDEGKKEEAQEKKASAIDPSNSEEVEKLAAALDEAADEIVKEADSIENGGESKQGGEQLATNTPTAGTQPYSKDGSKKNQPKAEGLKATVDNPGAATANATDDKRAPGGNGAKYPEKGVLKTAAEKINEKIAEFKGGGETLDSASSGKGPGTMQPGRTLIQNKDGIANVTKAQAKAPRKAELAQVLSEPAMTKSTDNKVHENLRNASKGGVKIAAAKALLQKIAEEGCKCEGKGSCPHCKLKAAVEKKKAEKKSE